MQLTKARDGKKLKYLNCSRAWEMKEIQLNVHTLFYAHKLTSGFPHAVCILLYKWLQWRFDDPESMIMRFIWLAKAIFLNLCWLSLNLSHTISSRKRVCIKEILITNCNWFAKVIAIVERCLLYSMSSTESFYCNDILD